jgi:uncharacterized protein YqcC (DUF446 family)
MTDTAPSDIYERLTQKIDQIEQELRRMDWWSETALPEEAFQSSTAFFADTMTYHQWVQFVFMERVRHVIEHRGNLPANSQVGLKAAREWEHFGVVPEAAGLVRLLQEFDAIVIA